MSTAMEIVVSAQDHASDVIEGIGDSADGVGSRIEDNWGKITAAGAAAGAASEGFARSQADSNAVLARAAIVTGESEAELRKSVNAMVDHTFSAHDAAAGMDELIRRGVQTRDGFEAVLPVMDSFSDATGKDLVESIGMADQVLSALGIPLEEVGDHVDQFTRIATQTDIPLGTLQRNLSRVAPELQALNFDVRDAAAGIEVFRARGLDGREATREFRRAVADSDGDMQALLDNLGVTADEFASYQAEVDQASGLTDEFADANNAAMTPIQRLQANVENLMFRYGGLAEAAGVAAPVMMSLGPAMKGVSVATRGLSAAMGFLAANPIVLVIAAIVALVAAIVVLWRRSETFRNVVTRVWEAVSRAVGWAYNRVLRPIFDALRVFFVRVIVPAIRTYLRVWQQVFSRVGDALRWVWQRILQPAFLGMRIGIQLIREAISVLGDTWARVWNRARQIFAAVVNPIIGMFNRLIGGVERFVNLIVRGINSFPRFTVPDWVPRIGGREFGLPRLREIELPRIPSLAQGGIVRARPGGRIVRVAEAGRDEAIVPLNRSGRDPLLDELRKIRQLLADGQTLVVDGQTLARVVARGLERRARGRGDGAVVMA